MSSDDNDPIDPNEMEPELPPQLEQLLRDIDKDRKSLLRTAAYGKNPEQLRQYIAQFVLPRLGQLIEIFGTALFDTYQLSSSNARKTQRMHRWAADHFRALGREVNDNDILQDIGDDLIERFSEAFYAIGTKLQEKLPEDKEMEDTYNRCAVIFDELLRELQGEQLYEEEEDEEEEDEDEEDEPSEKKDGEPKGDDAGEPKKE